ncbi:hypothetical protein NADFUDRAFT_82283 [Nadsonia fulvescens var. elongata DSM 6958]|uniref:C2H2-type domain-containing protein n=1 Tax=Nadsonia fulvescens var. elongata DSM 6958 TaxID=857566 RepID=A0A1E3PME7_9ASCO|nr:hypothetical protein NADFUDRAFT_82283 [Nadsonia fulvescens var. elongata DSM 6958]
MADSHFHFANEANSSQTEQSPFLFYSNLDNATFLPFNHNYTFAVSEPDPTSRGNNTYTQTALAHGLNIAAPVSIPYHGLAKYATAPTPIIHSEASRYPLLHSPEDIFVQQDVPILQSQDINISENYLHANDNHSNISEPVTEPLGTLNQTAINKIKKYHYPMLFGMDELASIDESHNMPIYSEAHTNDKLFSPAFHNLLFDESPRSSISSASSACSISSISTTPGSSLPFANSCYSNKFFESIPSSFSQSTLMKSPPPTDYSIINSTFMQDAELSGSAGFVPSTIFDNDFSSSYETKSGPIQKMESSELHESSELFRVTAPATMISPPELPSSEFKILSSPSGNSEYSNSCVDNFKIIVNEEKNYEEDLDSEETMPLFTLTRPNLTHTSCNSSRICENYMEKENRPKESHVDQIKANLNIYRNIEKSKKKGVYRRSHCTQRFRGIEELACHLDEQDIHRPYKCSKESCPWSILGFSKRGEWWRHLKHQHKNIQYFCPFDGCNRSFSRKDSYQRHLKGVHENVNSRFNKAGGKKKRSLRPNESLHRLEGGC